VSKSVRKKSPNQLRPFLSIAYYGLRAQLRNRATVFFGFAFPLIFIALFGLFGSETLSVAIGVTKDNQRGAVYEALSDIEAVNIEAGTESEIKEKLHQGRIGGVFEPSKGTTTNNKLLVSQADPQQAAAVTSLVNGVVDKINLNLANVKNPPVGLKIEEVSGRTFRFIDFFLPGMIGFALLSTAITSTAFGLVFLKKTLVLKRIFATPTRGFTILFGQGASRLAIVLVQALVILGMGILVYDFQLVHGLATVANILILSVIGLVAFLGFGLFVSGLSNDENTIAPVSNLIVLPQFLVAGTFFPIDTLPAWAQPLANNLPLAFFNTAMRKITVEGMGFSDLLPQLAGLAIWAVIAYVAASRTFRWE
jgi:ABC-2 type transport system permease protein